MSFLSDLSIGQQAEQLFVTTISKKSTNTDFTYNTSTSREELKKYDVKFCMNGTYTTAEVKHDKMAETTGNLAVEYCNHKGEKTGIASTEAEIYAFLVGEKFYCFETNQLKQLIMNGVAGMRIVDNRAGNASLILLPLKEAEKIAKIIPINLPKTQTNEAA